MKLFEKAIVDADSILYTVSLSAQEKHYKVDGHKIFTDLKEAEEEAEDSVEEEFVEIRDISETIKHYQEVVQDIKENTGAIDIYCYTGSPDGNFRKTVATIKQYKGNRKGPEPLQLAQLKEVLIESGDLLESESMLEADDQVIIEFRKLKEAHGEDNVVLCVIDKDAKQEPGHHYNFNTGEFTHLKPIDSLRHFYMQLAIGDSIDNILGLFNVGVKSALVKKIYTLSDEIEMFSLVYDEYRKRFGNYAAPFIMENFTLLYMLRSPNVDEGVVKSLQLVKNKLASEGIEYDKE